MLSFSAQCLTSTVVLSLCTTQHHHVHPPTSPQALGNRYSYDNYMCWPSRAIRAACLQWHAVVSVMRTECNSVALFAGLRIMHASALSTANGCMTASGPGKCLVQVWLCVDYTPTIVLRLSGLKPDTMTLMLPEATSPHSHTNYSGGGTVQPNRHTCLSLWLNTWTGTFRHKSFLVM